MAHIIILVAVYMAISGLGLALAAATDRLGRIRFPKLRITDRWRG